jgi:phosphatidylserine decarboxylase
LLVTALTIAMWCAAFVTDSQLLFYIAVLTTILSACIVFLFRNPQRMIPDLTDLDIISPADGKIIHIDTIDETAFVKKKAIKISIFLSLLDVHVNWIPVSGVVMHKESSDGKFLPAFTDAAGDKNKRILIGIECSDGFKVAVVQITGFIARRIRCSINPGQTAERGKQYGMIYLGSRVDIYVPSESKIMVKKGDHVKGGITVLVQKPNGYERDTIQPS